MKPQRTDEVFDLMDSYVTAAALGTAMELGLFWHLDRRPMEAHEVAELLQIPLRRCIYWLQVLRGTGLIEAEQGSYRPSAVARSAIIAAYSKESWFFLARESRERFPAVQNLTEYIHLSGSTWEAQGLTPPNYVDQMMEDPDRAEGFTRMLFELHQTLAEEIAARLDVSEAKRLLDLGGGSGVVSQALLRKHPGLSCAIVDIPNVCNVGREIAKENGMQARITYLEANFLEDALPKGFDLILQCDVGEHDPTHLRKLWDSLEPGGRLVIVDQFASDEGIVPKQYKYWAFLGSLRDPKYSLPTLTDLTSRLEQAGFLGISPQPLIVGDANRYDEDWVLVESRKE